MAASQISAAAAGGHRTVSAAAWRLIVLEFWERFSYYGILAILVLFLTNPSARGGFGWTNDRALGLLSVFAASAFTLPVFGGYIADRWFGARRCVQIGSSLLLFGNVALAVAAFLSGSSHALLNPQAVHALLYAGLAGIALGNGFFKSSLVTLLGGLIAGDDAARDRAFRLYYQAIMLGALASSLCVGALVQAMGWWSGFALAAAGMAIAWAIFLISPPPASDVPALDARSATIGNAVAPSRLSRTALIDIGILCGFLLVITIAWLQFQGLWLLEAERWVDRRVGAFSVPTPWLLAVNAVAIVVLTPLSGALWARLARPGAPAPGFSAQFVTAFAIMAGAHLLMAVGFNNPAPASVSLLWPAGCMLLITVAESIFWPASYNAIHRLAPAGSKSLLMGLWLAMLGIGQYLTHQVARSAEEVGFSRFSAWLGVGMLVACLALFLIARARPSLREV